LPKLSRGEPIQLSWIWRPWRKGWQKTDPLKFNGLWWEAMPPMPVFLSGSTGYSAVALEIPREVPPTGELLSEVLHPFLLDMQPDVIALLHTSRSQDYAATLAVRLDAACVSGVQGLVMQDGGPVFQRAVLGGKYMAGVKADDRPVVLTVLPGYFKFEGNGSHSAGDGDPAAIPAGHPDRLIEIKESATEAALTQATTVVAAGRGIGSEDNLDLLSRLAAYFPNRQWRDPVSSVMRVGCHTIDRWGSPVRRSPPNFTWPAASPAPSSTWPA
jgi:hypothetical protein